MKKKAWILVIIILLILAILGYYKYKLITSGNSYIIDDNQVVFDEEKYTEPVTSLKEEYHNNDIKAVLYIENTDFITPVVQTTDNDYYLKHLPDKSYNINGSVYFDYRIDIENTQKYLIYGHSSLDYDLPIEVIEKYKDKTFYDNHKYIYIDTEKDEKKFIVIGAYVETSNWEYTKVKFDTPEETKKHYDFLLSNSFYDTGIEITGNDNMLIIQTCATLPEYQKYSNKYFLLMAKEI